ncbi:hypothetical protein [Tolypothrix sp. VBCCA 56010]|uniref:hypothetical protein n=1 Tax=Tolypothrix sp. VBCCA 56010 TaxID=3137731 RepID=UPI003D7D074B
MLQRVDMFVVTRARSASSEPSLNCVVTLNVDIKGKPVAIAQHEAKSISGIIRHCII